MIGGVAGNRADQETLDGRATLIAKDDEVDAILFGVIKDGL